jgi:hypothetical protein
MAIESPAFRLIGRHNGYEIREYEPHILAQVEVTSGFEQAVNQGFEILAGYIFGDNRRKTHIAMTAPVTEEEVGQPEKIAMTRPVNTSLKSEGQYTVSFSMPRKYSLESLPQPNNPGIKIVSIPAHREAVLGFRGRLSEKVFRLKDAQLRSMLKKDSILPTGNSTSAQYDPPFVPWLLRRNEVKVEIQKEPEK